MAEGMGDLTQQILMANMAKQPKKPGAFNKIDQFIGTPGGGFLMNLLAQQGYSKMPHSPLGAIGKAALMSQNQTRERDQFNLEEQLMRSQIGLNDAKAGQSTQFDIGNPNPEKFTPESLAEYQRTGNAQALVLRDGAMETNPAINEIADDIRAESKDYSLQTAAYARIQASANDPSPAGDLALIFNYMKVLDPGSTVREGEFANAQNSGSLPNKIRALYNQVLEGTRLTTTQRGDFVNRAGQLYNSAVKQQQGRNDRFTQRGINAGIKPYEMIPILPPAEPVELAPYKYTPPGKDDPSAPSLTADEMSVEIETLQTDIESLEAEIAALEGR